MTPAEEIRAAAEVLRMPVVVIGTCTACGVHAEADVHVGLLVAAREPLAAWLESWDGINLREDGPLPDDFAHALAVARAINGGA